jgi:hypothetical protein
MPRLACVLSMFLMLALRLSATPCVAGATLASYEALGSTGCTIGTQTVKDFTFQVVSFGGGANPVTDNDITVTPTFGADFYGANFASTGFVVTGAGFVNYLIAYTWDSIPINGVGDVLDPPQNVDILTDGCVGAAFVGSTCSGTAVSVNVDAGQLTDFVGFSPTAVLGVRNNISLNAMGTTASFNSIENDTFVVPEPASFLLVGLGVMILARMTRSLSFGVR